MILTRPLIGAGVPKIDLSSCVFYAPLWRPDLAGSPFFDQVGHNSCTVTGATWGTQGRIFAGGDDLINAGNNSALDFTSGDFTLEGWIYLTNLTAINALFSRGSEDVDGYHLWAAANGRIWVTTNQAAADQNTYTYAGSVVVNNWYHILITRIGATVEIYINGVNQVDSGGIHINPLTSTRDVKIGVRDDGVSRWFYGTMGEWRVYNRALSAVERMNNNQATKGRY